ncbi:hypothetical protein MTF64_06540 [Pseudoalteromonas sp. 2CM41L]|uniref:hypothetical protein n=1 Tax=unclassified Pseudoalteromonas TaxID=194690 RepID=UPI0020BDBCD3|nr:MULTISPECIES: hypothetical protein [unclassified Pseudoalteromonas]MCK8106530.1 hypothetical protein [Pseudoalteromonas sp. 2CM41L]MCK8136605.1 hypothetical protein [Pseudoalteromonas sp. 2CM28B]
MKYQKGQSLVELSVFITFIIAPLMLLLPYFSKIIEAKHYSDMSSRYIAWERTTWLERTPGNWSGSTSTLAIKNSDRVHQEVPWRILNGHNSSIVSDSPAEEWKKEDAAVYLYFNQASQNSDEFLLAEFNPEEDDSNNHIFFNTELNKKSVPGTMSSLISGALSVLEIGNFSVEKKGYYEANHKIQITSHKLLEFINEDSEQDPGNENADEENKRSHQFEFPIESKTYLVANGWNVGGEQHNKNRVKSLVPSNLLDAGIINTLRDGLSQIPIAKKLNSSSLKFGYIKMDELPNSRKGSTSTQGNEK